MRIKMPKALRAIDKRCVVNPGQARSLLEAVAKQKPSGRRLAAFFAVICYAGLRPEEVVALHVRNVLLPEGDGWGEFVFSTAAPETDKQWNDNGKRREERQLKQQAANETRHVPCHPALVRILREHISERGLGSGDRLFSGIRGGELARATYGPAWKAARRDVLSQEEQASPLICCTRA
jgi:integrase